MREILFKAKRADNGEWVEGFYIQQRETTFCLREEYISHPDNTKHFIVFDRMTDWGLPNQHLMCEIDPSTLCQYTGIKDRNGNKIWENDILQRETIGGSVEGRVIWTDIGHAGFYLQTKNEQRSRFYPMGRGQYDDDAGEVCNDLILGNTFDNPELLEVWK